MRRIAALLLAATALTACEEISNIISPKDGDWPPMKWSHAKYKTVKLDGITYYDVPAQGGSYEFRCQNYTPWLAQHRFEAGGEMIHSYLDTTQVEPWHHYQYEWCTADVMKDTVRIEFGPNQSTARKASIGVTAGDTFDYFLFYQQSALPAE